MKYQFFKIPANDSSDAEAALNTFCSNHQIITVEKNFVADGLFSYWSFCITWKEKKQTTSNSPAKSRIDYKEILNDSDFVIYSQLRDLRKELAEKDGVPPYAVFTNEHLAAMVRENINSLHALEQLSGIGPAKVEKYGELFLNHLSEIKEKQPQEKNNETPANQP